MTTLLKLLREVRACTHCAKNLPLGPRPVLRMKRTATLLIIGQASGTKVHESGIPWNDRSGGRLRDWLAVDKESFYDDCRIATMPMGFCYPGVAKSGGDAPPRPECALLWHDRLRALLPNIELTLLIGQYAQARYLGEDKKKTMTDTVRAWKEYAPYGFLPLPHPSWRNTGWLKKNPWFEKQILPVLRKAVP